MQKKNQSLKSKMIAFFCVCLLVSSGTYISKAAIKNVTYKFVDSNSFTYVDSVQKASKTDYASVTITKFYKADGTPTDAYKKAYFQCGYDGLQATEVSCTINEPAKLILKGMYNAVNTPLVFYAMGNDASLDCYIDATLNADGINILLWMQQNEACITCDRQ